jgi:arylsulfatase A-like enzyme
VSRRYRVLADDADHVPFIVTGDKGSLEVSGEPGALADVAPTILDILGLPKPEGETMLARLADLCRDVWSLPRGEEVDKAMWLVSTA